MNILEQMHNVAAGVEHIHKMRPAKLGPTTAIAPASGRHPSTGLHFDLKPENILIFKNRMGSGETWKVSDFGTTRIYELATGARTHDPSHRTPNLRGGDPIYHAPDLALRGKMSRPYDIWSLGCVFLEILLWTFQMEGWRMNDFSVARLNSPRGLSAPSNAFWYEKDGEIGIKPVVLDKISALRETCKDRGVFSDVIQLIAEMLRIQPEHRPEAATIVSLLDSLIIQAGMDLEYDPTFYNEANGPSKYPLMGAPSEITRIGPKEGSEDRHLVSRRYKEPAGKPPRLNTSQLRKESSDSLHAERLDISDSESPVHITPTSHLTPDNRVRPRSPSIKKTDPIGNETVEHNGDDSVDSSTFSLMGSHIDSVSRRDVGRS